MRIDPYGFFTDLKKRLAFLCRLCYNARCSAGVAQLVERVIGNDEVHGSDSHHQLQKENHLSRVAFFLEL